MLKLDRDGNVQFTNAYHAQSILMIADGSSEYLARRGFYWGHT